MSSTRPAPKRVRSDKDHSKGDTKEIEQKRQKEMEESGEKEKNPKDKDQDNGPKEDEDWLSKGPFQVGKSWEGWTTKWRQSCWCNKTAFVYCEDPLKAKICHCEDCQRLHGAFCQHAAIFHKDNARLDSDPEWLGFLSAHGEVHPLSKTPTPLPHKISCRACGSPLIDEGRNMLLSFPPTFEFPRTKEELETMNKQISGQDKDRNGHADNKSEKGERKTHRREGKWENFGMPECFKAEAHIFYERRVVDIHDGLPKWRGHQDHSEQMGEDER